GTLQILLTATNDAGLGTSVLMPVTVLFPQVLLFPDPRLPGALSQAWKLPDGPITTVDLLGKSSLNLFGAGVSNLAGLEWATNLLVLRLDGNQISDLTPLTNMVHLAWLSASNNLIADISPLSHLPNLQYLDLSQNQITNYSEFLSGFNALTALYLG